MMDLLKYSLKRETVVNTISMVIFLYLMWYFISSHLIVFIDYVTGERKNKSIFYFFIHYPSVLADFHKRNPEYNKDKKKIFKIIIIIVIALGLFCSIPFLYHLLHTFVERVYVYLLEAK